MVEFDYKELVEATENFSINKLIGKGSHGSVYKAILKDHDDTNNLVAAIKKPWLHLHPDNSKLENEIHVLSSLPRNPHVVHFLGTSHDVRAVNRKLLVIEFMPNGSLHDFLHSSSYSLLSWRKRVELIIRIAKSIRFLHEQTPSIIHRDIKSANILFDSNWNPKLADFGLAVLKNNSLNNHETIQPSGTIGYLDPCYTSACKLSTKIDVFSFGVVLLEIISCRKAMDLSNSPASLVEWAIPLIEKRQFKPICDKRIPLPKYLETTVREMLHVASRCLLPTQENRPSMGEIVDGMENCFFERFRIRGSVWERVLRSAVLVRRRRSKVKCETNEDDAVVGYGVSSKRPPLLREILSCDGFRNDQTTR